MPLGVTFWLVRSVPSGLSLEFPIASLALSLFRGVWKLAKDSRNLAKTLYFLYLNFLICKMEAEG